MGAAPWIVSAILKGKVLLLVKLCPIVWRVFRFVTSPLACYPDRGIRLPRLLFLPLTGSELPPVATLSEAPAKRFRFPHRLRFWFLLRFPFGKDSHFKKGNIRLYSWHYRRVGGSYFGKIHLYYKREKGSPVRRKRAFFAYYRKV